jgi:hypothetical protein
MGFCAGHHRWGGLLSQQGFATTEQEEALDSEICCFIDDADESFFAELIDWGAVPISGVAELAIEVA